MQQFDWIISTIIFIAIFVFVMLALPSILPINFTLNKDITSDFVLSEISENVSKYTIITYDEEVCPFLLNIENLNIDYNLYSNYPYETYDVYLMGLTKPNYNYLIDYNTSFVFDKYIIENVTFDNYDYNFFDIEGETPTIVNGVLNLSEDSNIETKNMYKDYYATFETDANNITIYFPTINKVSDNNIFVCNISNNNQRLEATDGNTYLLDDFNLEKETEYRKIGFGYNKNLVFCEVNDVNVSYEYLENIDEGEIYIKTEETTKIDNFKIYKFSDISISDENFKINNDYLYAEVNQDDVAITFVNDENIDINLSFENNLVVNDTQQLGLVIDKNNYLKTIMYPDLNVFLILKDINETITFSLINNINYDLLEKNNIYMWLNANTIDNLNNNDSVTEWSDVSGKNNDATQASSSRQPKYKTNMINTQPSIYFDGNYYLETPLTPFLETSIFTVASIDNNSSIIMGAADNTTNYSYLGITEDRKLGAGVGNQDWSTIVSSDAYNTDFHVFELSYKDIVKLFVNFEEEYSDRIDGKPTSALTYILGALNYDTEERPSNFIEGYISEMIVYNKMIDENLSRLLLYYYFYNKYDIDSSEVMLTNYDVNEIVLTNTTLSKKIIFDIRNKNNNKINCNVDFNNDSFTINECEEEAIIKVTYLDYDENYNFNNFNLKLLKQNEKLITYKKINEIVDNNNFYINLTNNIKNISVGNNYFSHNIYERFMSYLNENLEIEIIKVFIKTF